MMVSFIICFLPALLATTSAQGILTCEKCYGIRQKCQAPTENCTVTTGVGSCRSAAAESTLGGRITSVFYKECIKDYNSGVKGPISFTVGNGLYLRVNATQCNDTEKCNSAVLEVPKESTTSNGWQCPTCFALNANPCNSRITSCTGDENYCISFAGQIVQGGSLSPFAAQGCGSASTQDIKPGTYLSSGSTVYLFEKATSTPADRVPTTRATTTLIPNTTTTPTTTTAPRTITPIPIFPITISNTTAENTSIITTSYVNTTMMTTTTIYTITLITPTTNITATLINTTTTTTITTPTNTVIITTHTTAVSITTATANPATTATIDLPPTSITTSKTLPEPTATALATIRIPESTPAALRGDSLALRQFSFAFYLPSLTGLLLVKLLS